MKFLTLRALLAAALFSAVVSVPFIADPPKPSVGSFFLEVTLTSTRPGVVQVYYPDAAGMLSEAASSKLPLVPNGPPRAYRLPLPSGPLSHLRLDPGTRPSAIVIESLRVVSRGGHVVREIPFSAITPAQQIDSFAERNGR